MANIDNGFNIEILSLNDKALVATGVDAPINGFGFEAPPGSLYLRQSTVTGEIYVKQGPNDVDWALLNTGSSLTNTDLASVVLGVSADTSIPLTFTNILWPVTHLENNNNIIEHSLANTDRILIKETGLYFLSFSISFDADAGEEVINARLVIDDTTVIPGSIRTASEDDEVNDLSNAFTAELVQGTYVTLQISATGLGNLFESSSNFAITRAGGSAGAEGVTGPPGSGSTINVLDEGILLPNSPYSALNFIGDQVTVSDAGSGQSNVTISTPVFGTEYQLAESQSVTTSTSTTFLNKLTFNTTSLPAGTYRVSLRYGWNHDNTSSDFEGLFKEDGTALGEIHKEEPTNAGGSFGTTGTSQRYYISRVFTRTLSAGIHTYAFDFRTDSNNRASSVWELTIEIWRVL